MTDELTKQDKVDTIYNFIAGIVIFVYTGVFFGLGFLACYMWNISDCPIAETTVIQSSSGQSITYGISHHCYRGNIEVNCSYNGSMNNLGVAKCKYNPSFANDPECKAVFEGLDNEI